MNRGLLGFSAVLASSVSLVCLAIDLPKELEALAKGKTSATTSQELKEITRWPGLAHWATSVAFSTDDQTLAIGLKDQIQLVDLATRTVRKTCEVKAGQIRSLAFSRDGQLLAAGGYQRVVVLHARTGELVQELKGHRGYVSGVAFSPDSQQLATACEDELGRIWRVKSEVPPVMLRGHSYPVTGVAWSPDGSMVATSAGDDTRPTKPGQVRVWDATTAAVKHQFELHSKAATGVAYSTEGHFLLSSSVDEHVNVYDLQQDKPLGFFAGHSRPTNSVVVHPDGETAISVSGGRAVGKNQLMVWEFATGETLASIEAHEAKITAVAVSHDGRQVATASQDRSVALWNVAFLAVGIPQSTVANAEPGAAVTTEKSSEQAADAAAVAATAAAATAAATAPQGAADAPKPKMLRAGIIGLDTSHAEAFTKTMNANPAVAGAEGCRVVAAYPKGSPDIKSSVERVPGYTETMKKLGVEIVDSIDELLKRVDVVLLETNDGRPHLEQILPCLKAGKPVFIDKPIAGSLTDAVAIFAAAKKYQVPVFSSSSLRFGKTTLAARGGSLGKITYCETSSPAALEPTHPDLFWYGIHGVESLFTVMGTGCQAVVRGKSAEGKIEVTGQWSGGRKGLFREAGGYQGKAVGDQGEGPVGSYDGYDPLVYAIVKFFQTGVAPVTPEETLEIYAFMEAADESQRQNGASVTLESVLVKARAEAEKKAEK